MITHKARIAKLSEVADEMHIDFSGETPSLYLARAVSTVPVSERDRLEETFREIISAVEMSGLEAKLPAELGTVNPNDINPLNHESLLKARVVLPLTYATSDGRGWEMGFAYLKKLIIPLIMPHQKINHPSIRLPFQIPVVYDGKENLAGLLAHLARFDIHFGKLGNELTVIGSHKGEYVDLRNEAKRYMEVIPYML